MASTFFVRRQSRFPLASPSVLFSLFALLTLSACSKLSIPLDDQGAPGKNFSRAVLDEESSRIPAADRGVPPESAAHYAFLRGEMALYDESFEEALGYYESAAEQEDSPAPFLRKRIAQMYIRAGKLDRALVQIDRALEQEGASNDMELLRMRAGVFAALEDFENAISAYRDIITAEPENQDAYILMSSLYAQYNKPEESLNVLKELISVVPDSLFGHYYVARILEAQNDFDGAEEFYRKASELNPESESVRLDLARVMALRGDMDGATAMCREVLGDNPNSVRARKLLGQLLWEGRQLDEALEELEKLRALVVDPTETRLKIALIKLERKDYEGAQEELELILASSPRHPSARYFLASAHTGSGQINDALDVLSEVTPEMEMYVESKTLQAYLLRQEERIDEAILAVEQALKASDKDVNLLLYLASLQRDGEEYAAAIETLRSVLEIEPDSDQHYFSIGVVYDLDGRKDDAIQSMRKAIELNPENADALNYLGYTLAELGKSLEEAEELVERALLLDPSNGYYLDSLGWVYFKMGRYEDALLKLMKAAKLAPNDAVILEHLGDAYLKTGAEGKALQAYEKAREYAPESEDKEVGGRIETKIQELQDAEVATEDTDPSAVRVPAPFISK